MKYETGKPTIRNRASVCNWELTFRFYTKDQCVDFITEYMKSEIPISFSYNHATCDSLTLDEHIITIEDGVWANNLKLVSEILVELDYNSTL